MPEDEETTLAASSTMGALLELFKSFVFNSYDYMLVFGFLYLVYYYYKNNLESLQSKNLPVWLVSFLNIYTFGYKSEEPASIDSTLLPLFRNRILSAGDQIVDLKIEAPPTVLGLQKSSSGSFNAKKEIVNEKKSDSPNSLLSFMVCFAGLQISYLLWGLMQERIVKYGYEADMDKTSFKKFNNSQFLVLTNRFAGLLVSLFILTACNSSKGELQFSFRKLTSTRNWAPLFVCSFSSLSNVLSSWFQYESLKYVSFTSQLLAKSSKSIFVMIVGRVVSNKRYDLSEYLGVAAIGLGVFLFCDVDDLQSANSMIATTLPGLICLVGYLISDGYTSNWQETLIKGYSMSSMTLMFMTNLYSCIFTLASLVHQDQLFESIEFMSQHKGALNHILLLSLTSAIGQIFIFMTIQKFGALIFSLIMTTRQVLSIILSSLIYQHALSLQSVIGIILIFASLFFQQCLKLKGHSPPNKSNAQEHSNSKAGNGKVVI